jgi:hypothetical protein
MMPSPAQLTTLSSSHWLHTLQAPASGKGPKGVMDKYRKRNCLTGSAVGPGAALSGMPLLSNWSRTCESDRRWLRSRDKMADDARHFPAPRDFESYDSFWLSPQ